MLAIDAQRDAGLTIASDAAGRMRIHTNGFRFDGARAVAIEDAVGKLSGVRTVRVYPRTASVVIRYSPEHCDSAAVLSAISEAVHSPAASEPRAQLITAASWAKSSAGSGERCWACAVTHWKIDRRSRGCETRWKVSGIGSRRLPRVSCRRARRPSAGFGPGYDESGWPGRWGCSHLA